MARAARTPALLQSKGLFRDVHASWRPRAESQHDQRQHGQRCGQRKPRHYGCTRGSGAESEADQYRRDHCTDATNALRPTDAGRAQVVGIGVGQNDVDAPIRAEDEESARTEQCEQHLRRSGLEHSPNHKQQRGRKRHEGDQRLHGTEAIDEKSNAERRDDAAEGKDRDGNRGKR